MTKRIWCRGLRRDLHTNHSRIVLGLLWYHNKMTVAVEFVLLVILLLCRRRRRRHRTVMTFVMFIGMMFMSMTSISRSSWTTRSLAIVVAGCVITVVIRVTTIFTTTSSRMSTMTRRRSRTYRKRLATADGSFGVTSLTVTMMTAAVLTACPFFPSEHACGLFRYFDRSQFIRLSSDVCVLGGNR